MGVPGAGATYPLTFGQEQLLAVEALSGPWALVLPSRIPLADGVSVPLAAEALSRVVRRHDALRLSAVPGGQEVTPDREVQPLPQGADPEVFGAVAPAAEAGRAPLFFGVTPNPPVLTLHLHHAFVDGWSAALITAEFLRQYEAAVQGRPPLPLPLPPSFGAYAAELARRADAVAVRRHLDFWAAELRDVPPLALPGLREPWRPGARYGPAPALAFELDDLPTARLLSAPGAAGSVPTVVLAGFAAALAEATGQDDLLLRTALSDRGTAERRRLVGCLVNAVALRVRLPAERSASALVQAARRALTAAARNQVGPFQREGRYRPEGRVLDLSPRVTLAFNQDLNTHADPALGARSVPAGGRTEAGVRIWPVAARNTLADLHLEVLPGPRDASLRFLLSYRDDLWDETAVAALGLDVAAWLRRLAAQ